MKNLLKYSFAIAMIMVFFSLFSGCKLKQKSIKKEKTQEETTLVTTETLIVKAVDSSSFKKVDTSKTKTTEQKKTSKTRIVDITIDLDSTGGIKLDSNDEKSTRGLINAALRNAKSLRLRIEEQQSEESNKSETKDLHKSDEGSAVSKLNSSAESKSELNQKKKSSNKDIRVDKDSTVVTNFGTTWIWIISLISLSFIGYKVYQKFKQNEKISKSI